MRISKRFGKLLIGAASASLVAAPRASVQASIPDREQTLNLTLVQPVTSLNKDFFNKDFFAKYIPTNITPTTNQDAFARQFTTNLQQKVSDRIVQDTLNQQPMVQNINNHISELSQRSLTLNTSGSVMPSELKFDVKPVERKAMVTYQGFVSSNVTYQMDTNNMILTLSKNLSKNAALSLQNISPAGQLIPAGNLNLTYNF